MTDQPPHDHEHFPIFAWPGGYTILYLDDDAEALCPECACIEHRDQGTHFTQSGYDEGPDEHCANCNRAIPSSYGDPDSPDN